MRGTVVQDKLPSGTIKFILTLLICGLVLMHCSQGQISGCSWMCTGPPCQIHKILMSECVNKIK